MLKLIPALLALLAFPASAQPLTPAETSRIDRIVTEALAADQVPSASIAIVRDGKIVLTKAYGKANEGLPATHRPALPDRVQFEAVHRDGAAAARGRGQAQPRRPCVEVPARHQRRRPDHDPPAAVAHLGPAGLLAAGLQLRSDVASDDAAGDRRPLGQEAARFPAGRPVAIFEHRLCRRRDDRREGQRRAAGELPPKAHLPSARDDQRPRPGRHQHAGFPGRLRPLRARTGSCRRRRRRAAGSTRRASCR